MSPPPAPLWRGRALALVGIVLFAYSLRTGVSSFAPLIVLMREDFELPSAVVGLIGTAPPVCYAVFGILTPRLERRFGLERLAVAAMAVTALGLAARGLAVDVVTLLLPTVVVFAGLGVGNILLPPLAKKYFPDRLGLVMTIYTAVIGISTFIPPLIAVPVAYATSWRVSIGMWAVLAAVAMIPWIALLLRQRGAARPDDEVIETASPLVLGRLWRSPIAWALTTGFVVSGVIAYIGFTWLPQILIDLTGASPEAAGAQLALLAGLGLPCALVVPMLVVRFHAARALYLVSVATGLGGALGLLLAPWAPSWIWVLLLGISGLLFPLTFILLALRTRTHESAVSLSAFVQSIGYGIAALFPLGFGLLHDATGSWTVPLLVLAVVIVCAVPAGVIAARPGTVEDEWERRRRARSAASR
ncbi:MAG: MFS transporter [Micrococcales bacterium 73-13]|nr:MAG: MFS transporter [Micrococcales bacterium 73-13]